MRYVNIPQTGLRVSQICLGSTDMGLRLTADDSFALMDEFVALGGNFIDTAHVYSNWVPGTLSRSEKTIGQWLAARNNRDQVTIGTKGAHPALETPHVSRLSPAEVATDISESLDYLQTDVIDLYWLHRDDASIPVGEIVDMMNEQIDAGKISHYGASNWTIARIQAAQDYAARVGKQGFVANQPMWSLAAPNMDTHPDKTLVAMDDEGLAFHRRTGMAAIAYTSQARGFFTKLDAGAEIPERDLFIYDNPANRARLDRVRALARQYGVQINDIALAYILSQPFPAVAVIGPKHVDHLRSSMNAAEITLTPTELTYLEGADS
jgi:aryl-alcohol dehydrogenase-like predicted oxidoreductase